MWGCRDHEKSPSSMDHTGPLLFPLPPHKEDFVHIQLLSKLLALVAELRRTGKREQACSKVEGGR